MAQPNGADLMPPSAALVSAVSSRVDRRSGCSQIAKESGLSASQLVKGLPADHPCARLHGYDHVLRLDLAAPRSGLNDVGFVRDFCDLDGIKELGRQNPRPA